MFMPNQYFFMNSGVVSAARPDVATDLRPDRRRCGTGIWPSRDIIAVRRHVAGVCPSLATAPPAMARTPAGNAQVFDLGRPTPVRVGLSAGGDWIRTSSTRARKESLFR